MNIIHIKFLKVTIDHFSLKEGIEFRVYFNDGAMKVLAFNSLLDDTEHDAERVLTKIRKYEKETNKNHGGDTFLDDFVNVVIEQEDEVITRLTGFFNAVKEKRKVLGGQHQATGYLDRLGVVKNLKLEF